MLQNGRYDEDHITKKIWSMVGYGISEENEKFVNNETISAIFHIRIVNLVEDYERAYKCK